MKMLFIVGCSRSGTTLLQQTLNRHPEILIGPETAFFRDLVGRPLKLQRRQAARIAADLEIELAEPAGRLTTGQAAADAYRGMAAAYASRVGRAGVAWFGDKTPGHLYYLSKIARSFPDARVLLIQRDGRDVALSLEKVPWSAPSLELNFGTWLRAARAQLKLEKQSPLPLLTIRYEDFVREPRATVRSVCGFLDLTPEKALMTRVETDGQGIPERELGWKERATQPIGEDRIEVWRRELDPARVRKLEAWGGQELEALGYELSDPAVRPSAAVRLTQEARFAFWRARALAGIVRDATGG